MTSYTKRRTFSREQWQEAQRAWAAGGFSDEWKPWRHLAAMTAGIIAPPKGDPMDSWSDDQPSERAMLIRAIRETPEALRAALHEPGARSWAVVVAILTRGRDRRLEHVEQDELDWSLTKARRGAMTPLGDVVSTLRDSMGVEP